jgi:hypothetical protein
MNDLSNAEILTRAGMSWLYVGPRQENLTHDPERETLAVWAELYTEDGVLLVAMRRVPGYEDHAAPSAFWYGHHSELLSCAALDSIPYVPTIGELDLHVILDLETEDAREAS